MLNHESVGTPTAFYRSHYFVKGEFWQQWQEYQDYLYRCCIKWMGGNRTDAEDALSRAMLKAWDKVQQFAEEITNFKEWLTRLTRNLCTDIQRERSRGINGVENIEAILYKQGLVQNKGTPERALDTDDQRMVIRRAIDNLLPRLRETFILHFYEELSYQEIAHKQEISYQNVCKRISEARAVLRGKLRGYFIGENEQDRGLSVMPTLEATESVNGEMSQENVGFEPIVEETITSFVAVTAQEKVEENTDGYRYVEIALWERLPALTLAWTQLDEETENWENYCLILKDWQKQPKRWKGWEYFLQMPRSPPAKVSKV